MAVVVHLKWSDAMNRTGLGTLLLCCAACLTSAPSLRADVTLHGLFTDNMVLQQGKRASIWGTADEGENVTVKFAGQTRSATAQGGKWMVKLGPLEAGGPHTMTVAGKNRLTLTNVLVGEVWLCSGQWNMSMPLHLCENAADEIADSANSSIRLCRVRHKVCDEPQTSVKCTWQECAPDAVRNFSGLAYFFAKQLHKARRVPIGVVNTSVWGAPAEAWASLPVLKSDPKFQSIFDRYAQDCEAFPDATRKHKKATDKWRKAVAKAKKDGKPAPNRPSRPRGPGHPCQPAGLYNGMIAPLMPYAIAGVIWYEGESNVDRAGQYRALFPAAIKCWRDNWGQGNFPFLFVQLAARGQWGATDRQTLDVQWAALREAQALALKLPKTAMVVTTDLGDPGSYHPVRKQQVGERLARAARAVAYGEYLVHSGPVYDSMQKTGSKIVLTFNHVGQGLTTKGDCLNLPAKTGYQHRRWKARADEECARLKQALADRSSEDRGSKLKGFAVAGEDRQFVWAHAEIVGQTVVVSSPKVARPIAVRYAWESYPICNLFNRDGLPAAPFRTDRFPLAAASGASGQR